MTVDLNFASVLGASILLLISIIGYFLRSIMDKLTQIERDKNQTALDIAKLQTEVRNLADEQHQTRDKMKLYDANIEAFWKDFGKMVSDALAPQFKHLDNRLDRLEKGK